MCWSIKELLHNAYVLDNLIACVLVEEGGEIAKMSINKEVTVPNRGGTSRLPGTPQLGQGLAFHGMVWYIHTHWFDGWTHSAISVLIHQMHGLIICIMHIAAVEYPRYMCYIILTCVV